MIDEFLSLTPRMPFFLRIGEGRALVSPKTAWLERELAALVNNERLRRRLKPLIYDRMLAQVARAHSADEAIRGYYSHNSPEGHDVVWRYEAAGYFVWRRRTGYPLYQYAENIHCVKAKRNGVLRPLDEILAQAHRDWMRSRGHRKNILHPNFLCIGVGVVYNGRENFLLTQNFA